MDKHVADVLSVGTLVGYWLGLVPAVFAAVASLMAIVWYGFNIYDRLKRGPK